MPHRLRFLPPDPSGRNLVEVALRCIQGRFLLRPSEELNLRLKGVLGKAQQKYAVEVHAYAVMSNHLHLLLSVSSQKQLSSFMNFVGSNIARAVTGLHDWSDKVWGQRYSATPIVGGEKVQIERFRYHLSQGTKEGLVESPFQWPGLQSAKESVSGQDGKGIWIDHTGLYRARQKLPPDKVRAIDFEEDITVKLSPIPCWAHLPAETYQERVRDLIRDIESSARAERKGAPIVGRRAIRKVHPHYRPKDLKRTLAPLVHAPSRRIRRQFLEGYRIFCRAFRVAAERLLLGDRTAEFPEGSFPPGLPFVERDPKLRPG